VRWARWMLKRNRLYSAFRAIPEQYPSLSIIALDNSASPLE
jgi:hypothetical protein